MKTYKYLWMIVCILLCQSAYPQLQKNNKDRSIQLKQDPTAQLKQLLQLPRVGPPSLKMPGTISQPKRIGIPAFNIAAKLAEAKLQCPLLNLKPTLQLEGERKNNEEVGLEWKTKNAFNNRAFDVERSLADTFHFEKINFVWAGAEDKYRLPDDNDYAEVSYYRLKLLLNDGSSVYSNIAAVKGYNNLVFTIYPNPASDKLKMSLLTKVQGSANITVFDASGRMVQQESSVLTKGYDLREIDVTKLPGGSYTVKIRLPDKQIITGKFVKN